MLCVARVENARPPSTASNTSRRITTAKFRNQGEKMRGSSGVQIRMLGFTDDSFLGFA
jgi:hypothetical protein